MPNRFALALTRFASAVAGVFRPTMQAPAMLSPPLESNRGWWTIFDWRPGAFQADDPPVNTDRVLQNWAVYACLRLISSDLGKMRLKLVELGDDGIWRETRSAAFSPVLKKPNRYQTRQKFVESWVISRLGPAGNTYVLKERDNRGIVTGLHVLDPWRVTPLIAPDGSVWYRLGEDNLAQVTAEVEAMPASEIIHDRDMCLFHPLVGVSPIYACGLAAQQGLSIQRNSDQFFANRSMPGGVLTAPHEISEATAERLKREWNSRYSGDNAGKTAVLGDGLTYVPFAANARDSQAVEQLMGSAKAISTAFGVPPFKIGLEALPAGQTVEGMNRIYYADCLQTLIESIEALLDEGLGLEMSGKRYGTEFETDDLMRMDNASLISSLKEADGIMAPNEQRMKLNLPPVDGGANVYKQEQDHSLEALAKRDAREDPFGSATAPASASAARGAPGEEPSIEERMNNMQAVTLKCVEAMMQAGLEKMREQYRAEEDAKVEAAAIIRRVQQGLLG